MSKYTIHPWTHPSSLLTVREQLYSSTPALQQTAIARILAWKLRGNLPHAIESTALLTDAILHHSLPSASNFSIRAVYTAAFTRFVTGFCDIGRNRERTLEPSSMLVIAKQIGMPVHFVSLRHEATHEEMPSLQRLVRATEEALKWLWGVYWSRLKEPVREEVAAESDLAQVRTEAKTILKTYRTTRLEALRSKKRMAEQADHENLLETSRACINLIGRSQSRLEAFCEVLVQEKMLVPQKRELGSPLDGAYMIWDQLILFLAPEYSLKRFLDTLVRKLLDRLGVDSPEPPERDIHKEGLFFWTVHLIIFKTSGFSPDKQVLWRREAMKWCCINPGFWSNKLGEVILQAENEDFKYQWREIFEASRLDTRSDGVEVAEDIDMSSDAHISDAVQARSYADAGSWVRAAAPVRAPLGMIG